MLWNFIAPCCWGSAENHKHLEDGVQVSTENFFVLSNFFSVDTLL